MAAKSMKEIALSIQQMRFRKKLFGGVDESDVWKQIQDLHKEYQAAFDAQQEAGQIRLREKDREIQRLKKRLKERGSLRGDSHE